MTLTTSDILRFEKYVVKGEGCWPCTRAPSDNGYIPMRTNNHTERQYVHRIAYYLATGTDPKELMVCHTCDNRICCNPEHLFLGTCQDNTDDKVAKNRQTQNETQPNHVLSNEQVKQIRFLDGLGFTGVDLARKFNTSASNIGKIVNRKQRK